jgi:hypothetical protein
MFSQDFSIIGVGIRELHLLKVEGVKLSVFSFNLSKWFLVQSLTLDKK